MGVVHYRLCPLRQVEAGQSRITAPALPVIP
jgi:hypothetical protein